MRNLSAELSAPPSRGSRLEPREPHALQLYDDDAFLLDRVERFLGEGLRKGEGAIVVATAAHRTALADRLRAAGWNAPALEADGRYVSVDAAGVLSTIMDGDLPTASRFDPEVGRLLDRVAGPSGRPVRVFGEMVALLASAGRFDAAVELERLWNRLAEVRSFSLLCAYPMRVFAKEGTRESFAHVCAQHGTVAPSDGYGRIADPDQQLREVARLQQQASVRVADSAAWLLAQQRQAHYAAIVESSEDAIVSKTLDGTITSWNRAAERIFGYTANEMIGQPIARLIPADRPDDFHMIRDTIQRGERVEHFETERIRKDGTRIDVSLTVSPIRDLSGRVIGASKIARDVTKRRRAEGEREELLAMALCARREAEAANRAKDEFLAMLGHELRNPLAAVRSGIASAQLDGAQRDRSLDIARRQTDQLARLVDDLLDVARITHGRIPLQLRRVAVADVVARAVESVGSLVEDRGLTLSVSLPPDGVHVEGDAARLEQVVVNVLGNAAKYTPRGGAVRLEVERDRDEALVRITDTGVGIEPEMMEQIFELFVQARSGLDRARGGMGIGLTIVKKLVELHGGRVIARSGGPGKGAEFVIRLPASTAEENPAEARAAEATASVLADVLVVEDNADAAESLTMLLQIQGHRVAVAHDGIAALYAAGRRVPDVMLVDIGLPGIDGFEFARRVRRDPRLNAARLVALTGYGREEDQREAAAAGFDHFLVKPVEPDELQQLIARLGAR